MLSFRALCSLHALVAAIAVLATSSTPAQAVLTFGIEAGGASTITVFAGTTVTADVTLTAPGGAELAGSYGISVDFGADNVFVQGSSTPPPMLFPPPSPPAQYGPGVARQWTGLSLFGPVPILGTVTIGTITFVANKTSFVETFVASDGIDGVDPIFFGGGNDFRAPSTVLASLVNGADSRCSTSRRSAARCRSARSPSSRTRPTS